MISSKEEMRIRFVVARAWSNAYVAAIRVNNTMNEAQKYADKAAKNINDILRETQEP